MWNLWDLFVQSMTDKLRVACNILAFAIPYIIYKINQKLHKIGDPPWKNGGAENKGRSS